MLVKVSSGASVLNVKGFLPINSRRGSNASLGKDLAANKKHGGGRSNVSAPQQTLKSVLATFNGTQLFTKNRRWERCRSFSFLFLKTESRLNVFGNQRGTWCSGKAFTQRDDKSSGFPISSKEKNELMKQVNQIATATNALLPFLKTGPIIFAVLKTEVLSKESQSW